MTIKNRLLRSSAFAVQALAMAAFLVSGPVSSLSAQVPAAATATPRPLPAGIEIAATVDARKLVIGDSFRYSITVNGNINPEQTDSPSFMQTGGLELLSGPASRTEMSIVNGQSTVRISTVYTLRALKTGTFTIPPARVKLNGYWYGTNEVTLEIADVPDLGAGLEGVISAKTQSPEVNREMEGNYFALADVPQEVYRGQPIPVKIYIYRSPNFVSFVQWEKIREAASADFIVPTTQDQLGPRQLEWETIRLGGKDFVRTLLYTTWVVPTKTGEVRLTPPFTRIYLQAQQRNSRRIEDFMFGPQLVAADLEVRTLKVKVLDPPAKPAAALSQIVGDVLVESKLDRAVADATTVTVPQRELLTLAITFAGEGFLDLLVPPELPPLPGLIQIDKATKNTAKTEEGRFVTEKTFEYIFQATAPGDVSIPEFSFAVFNPRTAEQKLVTTKKFDVKILPVGGDTVMLGAGPAAATGQPAAAARPGARVLASDVDYIDASPLTAAAMSGAAPFFLRPWFWLLQLVPIVGAFGYGFLALARSRRGNESDEARTRRLRAAAAKALQQARASVGTTSKDAFYQLISRSALEFAAAQIGRPASGLTTEEAGKLLEAKGIPALACSQFSIFMLRCDAARFSPTADSEEMRRRDLDQGEAVLAALTVSTGAAK